MMELLTEIGVGVGHPIVWVGHSKGGIFAKQIMVDAWESGNATLAPLWRSSRGCVFYSVPHRGSPLADFNLPLIRQSVELEEIKKSKRANVCLFVCCTDTFCLAIFLKIAQAFWNCTEDSLHCTESVT